MTKSIPQIDVLVIGAGPAGIGAAYAAASKGMNVCVVEKSGYPGGRATASAVGTICGIYFRGEKPVYAMNGFTKLFAGKILSDNNLSPIKYSENLWFIPSMPHHFKNAAEFFLNHKNIHTYYYTSVKSIELQNQAISSVTLSGQTEDFIINPSALIDCSGTGISLELINHPVINIEHPQASAMVFCLENVLAEDEFALRHILIKHLAKNAGEVVVPEYFKMLSIVPASLKENSVLLKAGLPWDPADDPGNLRTIKLVHEIFDFIKNNVSAFRDSRIRWIADEVGQRTGIRPVCKSVLSHDHIIHCTKSTDSICHGVWPVEFWEMGKHRVSMEYFPENEYYSIPASCLISSEVINLFFAGKLISSSDKAIASARVIGTCLATGYAAGILATGHVSKTSIEQSVQFIQSQIGKP